MTLAGSAQTQLPGRSTYWSVALISAALIAYQVNLVQIFSFVQWYHFAYMAISIALLGFGAAGSLLAIAREWLLARYNLVFPLACVAASIAMGALMLFKGEVWWHFETYHIDISARALIRLIGSYLLLVVPFLFGALALGMAFTAYARQINKLYAADLAGSACGALLAVFLASALLPHYCGIAIAVLPLTAAVLMLPWHRKLVSLTVTGGTTALLTFSLFVSEMPHPSEYKPLSKAELLPEAHVEYTQPNPQGVLQVLSSPVLRHAPGISMTYTGMVPVVKGAFRNGEWFGALGDLTLTDTSHIYDHSGFALPFALDTYDTVLVIQDPTASMTQYVLQHQARHVTLALPDAMGKMLLASPYASETDSVWFLPAVSGRIGHIRRTLLTDTNRYDLIVLPSIGQFGSTGQMATQEDYVYTRQNMALLWERLQPAGCLVVSCWLDTPARVTPRLFRLLVYLLGHQGVLRPLDHIIAAKNWGMVTYVVRKQPWDELHYMRADSFCRQRHFDAFIQRGTLAPERGMLHTTEDTNFMHLHQAIAKSREDEIEAYDYDVSVPDDDSPYFYNFIRLSGIGNVMQTYGRQSMFVELGYFFVLTTLVCVSLIAFILIVLPLFRIGFRGKERWFTLLYFGAIGIGFMCVEITLLHRSIPYLGSPTTAFATTLSALLIASALGSYTSRRQAGGFVPLRWALMLMAILAAYNTFGTALWNAIAQSGTLRYALVVLLVGIPGFCMGLFFPAGITRLKHTDAEPMIPWAWGINGFFSVISAVLALVLAMECGYDVVIWVAVAAYGIAIWSGRR